MYLMKPTLFTCMYVYKRFTTIILLQHMYVIFVYILYQLYMYVSTKIVINSGLSLHTFQSTTHIQSESNEVFCKCTIAQNVMILKFV